MSHLLRLALAAGITLLPALQAAAVERVAPETPATHHHGLPGNNPGFGGASANPQGEGKNGGNGIHGIGNVPGKNAAAHPSVGEPGFRDQLGTVHGGLGHKH